MTRVFVGLSLVLAALASLFGVRVFPNDEHEHPPHTGGMPKRNVTFSYGEMPDALAAASTAVDEYLRGEHERLEREALEEAERVEAARRVASERVVRAGGATSPSGDCASIPVWFPTHIAWRESNCTRGINTGNGYYGYGQVAGFHWFGGICDGLTWTVPSEEDECVWRLSRGATNFAPWSA